jgi:ribonuclease PH
MDEASILTAEPAITTHVNPEDGSVRVSTVIGGRTYELESGLYARQADAAVMVRHGDTMVLVTVCAAEEPSPTVDFLPLSVDYREKSSAAGKIPGSFFRREGRPTDKEVLSARLIDRPCRPLFPKTWRYETQIIATVFSYDQEIDGDTLGATGASAALMISDIPFAGPISEVRVGRVDGEFRINPSFSELERSDMDLVVAGSDSSIVMVEGSAKEISEADFLQALEFAHGYIRQLNALQRRLQELLGRPKREIPPDPTPEELRLLLQQWASEEIRSFIRQQTTKEQRSQWRKALRERMLEQLQPILAEQHPEWAQLPLQSLVAAVLTELERAELRRMILTEGRRLDGRTPQQIRPILCRVGVLPRTHGSAFFMRGETQSLATVTLGTKGDEQIVDGLLPTYTPALHVPLHLPALQHWRNPAPRTAQPSGDRAREPRRARPGVPHPSGGGVPLHHPSGLGHSGIERLLLNGKRMRLAAWHCSTLGSRCGRQPLASLWDSSRRGTRWQSSPTSSATKTIWAIWTSRSPVPPMVSPRARWTSKSRGSPWSSWRKPWSKLARGGSTSWIS